MCVRKPVDADSRNSRAKRVTGKLGSLKALVKVVSFPIRALRMENYDREGTCHTPWGLQACDRCRLRCKLRPPLHGPWCSGFICPCNDLRKCMMPVLCFDALCGAHPGSATHARFGGKELGDCQRHAEQGRRVKQYSVKYIYNGLRTTNSTSSRACTNSDTACGASPSFPNSPSHCHGQLTFGGSTETCLRK